MNAEIALETFQYRDYFPHSKKVALFETLQREKHPDRLYPFFDSFANPWFDRQKAKWKTSYQKTVRNTLDRYLIPEFGNTLINEIRLANVDYFRQSLMQTPGKNGKKKLSNRRINGIFWPLVAIMSLAADEFQFTYPLRRYKALKEEESDSHPMTIDEVHTFLGAVEPQWQDYFIVRFWTGMRSCEVHGLFWDHIDFDHRLIRIRQNLVNGELGDVKRPRRTSIQRSDVRGAKMTLLNFSQPWHFSESQTDLPSLAGFALGAQHPRIFEILQRDGELPSSLETQEEMESIAEQYWEAYQQDKSLRRLTCQHAQAIVYSRNRVFEDLGWHISHPELPLVKYYAALLEAEGQMEKEQVWRRHLVYCRTLCLALHEQQRHPIADVCYSINTVMVNIASEKQFLSYCFRAAAQYFQVDQWTYVLLPMPLENNAMRYRDWKLKPN